MPLFSISVVNLSESSFTSTVATDLVEKMAQKSVVHSYRSTKFDMLYIRLDSLVVGRILLPPRELLQRTETMTTLLVHQRLQCDELQGLRLCCPNRPWNTVPPSPIRGVSSSCSVALSVDPVDYEAPFLGSIEKELACFLSFIPTAI